MSPPGSASTPNTKHAPSPQWGSLTPQRDILILKHPPPECLVPLVIAGYLIQDGLANGAIYALMGIVVVLVFTVTRVIFIPLGEMTSFAALGFIGMSGGQVPGTAFILAGLIVLCVLREAATAVWRRSGPASLLEMAAGLALPALAAALGFASAAIALPMAAQAVLAIALTAAMGPVLYRLAYQPVARASVLVLLIVSVALHFALIGIGLYVFGPSGARAAPFVAASFTLGGVPVPGQTPLILACTLSLIAILYAFFRHSLFGKALMATAVNRTGARLMGISPDRSGRIAFFLAALIAGLAGVLIAPTATIYYDSGFLLSLKGFVGAVIGGLSAYPPAALGALAVGLIESYASFAASSFKEAIVFGLMIPVLLARSLLTLRVAEDE